MARSQRDLQDAHIADPAACASMTGVDTGDLVATEETGGGAWGTDTEAQLDNIRTQIVALVADCAALKTAIDANNTAIDAILVAIEEVGIVAKA